MRFSLLSFSNLSVYPVLNFVGCAVRTKTNNGRFMVRMAHPTKNLFAVVY